VGQPSRELNPPVPVAECRSGPPDRRLCDSCHAMWSSLAYPPLAASLERTRGPGPVDYVPPGKVCPYLCCFLPRTSPGSLGHATLTRLGPSEGCAPQKGDPKNRVSGQYRRNLTNPLRRLVRTLLTTSALSPLTRIFTRHRSYRTRRNDDLRWCT